MVSVRNSKRVAARAPAGAARERARFASCERSGPLGRPRFKVGSRTPERSFSAHPLLALVSAFAGGILSARLANLPLTLCLTTCLFASVVSLVVHAKRAGRASSSRLLLVCFFSAGALLAAIEMRPAGERRLRSFYEDGRLASNDPVELTGVLERPPEAAPDGLLLALRAEGLRFKGREEACEGRVEIFAPFQREDARRDYDALELRRGARLRVIARFTRAERFRNPGVSPVSEFLELRDVDARATLKSPLLVERLDDEAVLLPLVWLDRWRLSLEESIDANFSTATAGTLKAAMLGNRRGLTRASAESHREGGTFHLLVVSGLHVTFVGGAVWLVARRLTRRPLLQWAASVACVWGFAVGVGAAPSVVRASLMFTLATLAPALGRRSASLNATGGAALALLVWRPSLLFDPSFQLTFLSVLAIVALALPLLSKLKDAGEWRPSRTTPHPPLCPAWFTTLGELLFWRERAWRSEMARAGFNCRLFKSRWAARLDRWRAQPPLRYAFSVLVVSTVVQLTLLPLLVLYFHRLSLAAPLLNIFTGALMVAASACALVAVALSWDGRLAAPFVWATEWAARSMEGAVLPFVKLGVASLRLPEYTGAMSAVYVLYLAPLVVLAFALYRWRPVGASPPDDERERDGARLVLHLTSLSLVVVASIIILHPLSAGLPDGRLRVDFLDVGQGDAALLTMPDGTTLLVDGGGRMRFGEGEGDTFETFERDARGIGEAVVSEYLWWRGLDRLNFVLATHADADHIEGLGDVLRNFSVDAAIVGRAPGRDREFARFRDAAERAGVPVRLVGRGDLFRFGAVAVEVLWPPFSSDPGASARNDDSVVLRVRYGRRTFLLTGDVEARAESALLASGDDLTCDVLKVAHHGSRTSSTQSFIDAARPRFAVVPVGLDSPHGHPHEDVVARLLASGARLLTTGESGAITFSTDGEDLKLERFAAAGEGRR